MGPGGFPSLQNWRDLTASGWVGSIPTRSRHGLGWSRVSRAVAGSAAGATEPSLTAGCACALRLGVWLLLAALLAIGSAAPRALHAQRADSARAGVETPRRAPAAGDSVPRRPVSPRGAFLRSVLVPGWGQIKLDRGLAAGIFVASEVLFISMVAKSKRDLDVARRFARDSIIESYDNTSGTPVPVYAPSPFARRVRPRREHYEDWIALVVFNHLLAGADAYVGAQLWDVPARVSIRAQPDGATLVAQMSW